MKKELVDQLIANTGTHFDESDREWLAVLHDEQGEKMLPVEDDGEDTPATLEEFVASAPDEFKGVLESALNQREENRKGWIANVMAHPANKFTAEQLQAKPCTELVALNEMLAYKPEPKAPTANEGVKVEPLKTPGDFRFQSPPPVANAEAKVVPLKTPSLTDPVQ